MEIWGLKLGMRHSKPGPPRNVLVLLIAVAAVSVAALVWLSWRLLEQDRALENQRIQERLERTADLIVTSLDLGLSEIENRLSALSDPGDHALSVAFGPREVETHPGGRLLYYPYIPPVRESPVTVFVAGEILEFRQQDYVGAIAVDSADYQRRSRRRFGPASRAPAPPSGRFGYDGRHGACGRILHDARRVTRVGRLPAAVRFCLGGLA
jgi:hypothetical protein